MITIIQPHAGLPTIQGHMEEPIGCPIDVDLGAASTCVVPVTRALSQVSVVQPAEAAECGVNACGHTSKGTQLSLNACCQGMHHTYPQPCPQHL
jgi:hypothetical protein